MSYSLHCSQAEKNKMCYHFVTKMYISVKNYLHLAITALTVRIAKLLISFFSLYICPFFLPPLGYPFYGCFFDYADFSC